jgi:3-phosphoshikimate 1-carboxyvinyltransferase
MLAWFGAPLETEALKTGTKLSVEGSMSLKANDFRVPGDVSSSAFFMVAAASLPGSELVLEGVGLNPSRTAVIDVLRQFGAEIDIKNERTECNEPVGDIAVKGGIRSGGGPHRIDGKVVANLIDEIPILAVFGTQLEGGLEVRDAAELRVKESDRINAVVEDLKRMGADVAEYDDGFKVARSQLRGARVDSFGDHRIAMAFAVAALFANGETEIIDADCAGVSYPGFFDALRSVSS